MGEGSSLLAMLFAVAAFVGAYAAFAALRKKIGGAAGVAQIQRSTRERG